MEPRLLSRKAANAIQRLIVDSKLGRELGVGSTKQQSTLGNFVSLTFGEAERKQSEGQGGFWPGARKLLADQEARRSPDIPSMAERGKFRNVMCERAVTLACGTPHHDRLGRLESV
ncbi:hypothetical protein NL676_027408 [Syzygium grande]|nr:hypothetical protein NL676_027408 [Syzygium grande]